MPQYALPNQDISVGSWSPTPLYSQIGTVVRNDATTIQSEAGVNTSCELGFSTVVDPVVKRNFIFRFAYRVDDVGGHQISFRCILYCGSNTVLNLIYNNIENTTLTLIQVNLTASQMNAIDDFSQLRVVFERDGETGGGPATRRFVIISWCQLEVPDFNEYNLDVSQTGDGNVHYIDDRLNKKLDFNAGLSENLNSCRFSPNGEHLAVALNASPGIAFFGKSGETFIPISNPPNFPSANATSMDFSVDNNYLAIGLNSSPFIIIYKIVDNSYIKLPDPSSIPSNIISSTRFSHDSTYLVLGCNSSPFVIIYKREGDVFTRLSNLDVLPLAYPFSVDISYENDYLAVGTNNINEPLVLYKRDGDNFNKISPPEIRPSNIFVRNVSFSHFSNVLIVSCNTSVVKNIFYYEYNEDIFTSINKINLVPGIPYQVAFSSTGKYLGISCSNYPFFRVYKKIENDYYLIDNIVPKNLRTLSNNLDFLNDESRIVIITNSGIRVHLYDIIESSRLMVQESNLSIIVDEILGYKYIKTTINSVNYLDEKIQIEINNNKNVHTLFEESDYYTINISYVDLDNTGLTPILSVPLGSFQKNAGNILQLSGTFAWHVEKWEINEEEFFDSYLEYEITENVNIVAYVTFNGLGTESSPFLIKNEQSFLELGNPINSTAFFYKQMRNLDFEGIENPMIENFEGVYDGNNFLIKNITIDRPDLEGVGLFKSPLNNLGNQYFTFQNIIIDNITVIGIGNVGGLADVTSSINNCHITNGMISGGTANIGGVIGRAAGANSNNRKVYNSSFQGVVSGTFSSTAGGFIGYAQDCNINNCRAKAVVYGGSLGTFSGQLYGGNSFVRISDCYGIGEVHCLASSGGYMGTFTGQLGGSFFFGGNTRVFNCYGYTKVITGSEGTTYTAHFTGNLAGGLNEWEYLFSINTSGLSLGIWSTSGVAISSTITTSTLSNYTYFSTRFDLSNIWDIDTGTGNIGLNESFPFLRAEKPVILDFGIDVQQYQKTGMLQWSKELIIEISNVGQLDNIRHNLKATYILVNNINLGSIGNWIPIPNFEGSFYGNGYNISNLTSTYGGLFGNLINGAYVENLNLINVNIVVNGNAGGFAVVVNNSTIKKCRTTGSIQGTSYVGGIASSTANTGALIIDCINEATIHGENASATGGILGYNATGPLIKNCINKGNISGGYQSTSIGFVGGICGRNYNAKIENCYNVGSVIGTRSAGGISGENGSGSTSHVFGEIVNCYNVGDLEITLSGTSYIGGIVSYNRNKSTISRNLFHCYHAALITHNLASHVGGLVGRQDASARAATFCYWDTEVSTIATSPIGLARTTQQMTDIDNYLPNWDFEEIWMIDELKNNGYPYLIDLNV